jgi:hypothetical protein
MRQIFVFAFFAFISVHSCAQVDKKQNDNNLTRTSIAAVYRLFPTQNMWTFIKLNTRNGQIWQVQFDVQGADRLTSDLSLLPLVSKDDEVNERFTLYSTQNIYTFILLDQLNGKTWQVQWSIDPKKRSLIPIE